MTSETQSALHSALLRLLRPLVRVMLRHGMAYGTFAELTRRTFVDEALAMLRRSGKRQSISSVAAMTGLTRKEAARLAREDGAEAPEPDQRYNRAVRVITAWALDPRFLDDGGQPLALPLEGDAGFAALVKDYSGDVTPRAMLATLESSGTVTVRDGAVHLLQRAYLPTETPAASLHILGNDVAELVTAIDHNLAAPAAQRVFQRKVSNSCVEAGALEAFRDLSNRKSQELLEAYDAWLSDHEVKEPEHPAEDARYVAVGIYYFDDTICEE
jgi:hypothetical protein